MLPPLGGRQGKGCRPLVGYTMCGVGYDATGLRIPLGGGGCKRWGYRKCAFILDLSSRCRAWLWRCC